MIAVSYFLYGIIFTLLLKEYYSVCEDYTTCSNCIGNVNAYLRYNNDNLECYWCSDTNICSTNNSTSSCLHFCNDDDGNTSGNGSADMYTLIFIIGIIVFSCGGCAVCYITRKSNSVGRMRELISPLLRSRAKDAIFKDDESEWMCVICGFDNKLRNIYCIMCGTDQKFTDEYRSIKKKKSNFNWHKSNKTKQLADDKDILIPEEAQMTSSSVSMSLKYFCAGVDPTLSITKRKEAINYRRLNQLNLRQKSARRRKMWQRRVDHTTGQLVWMRIPIYEDHNLVATAISDNGSYEEEGRQSLLRDRKVSGSDSLNSSQSTNSYVPNMYNPIADLMQAASNQGGLSPISNKGRIQKSNHHDSYRSSPMNKRSFDSFNDSVLRSHSPGFTSVFDKEGELVWEKIDCQNMKPSKVHQDHSSNATTNNPSSGPVITKYTSPMKTKPLLQIRQQRLYQPPPLPTTTTLTQPPQNNSIRNLRASSTSSTSESIAKNLFPLTYSNQTLDTIDHTVSSLISSSLDVTNTQQVDGIHNMNNTIQSISIQVPPPPPPQLLPQEDITPMDSLLYILEPEEVDLAGIAALSFRGKYSWFLDRLAEFQIPPDQGYIKIEVRRNKLLEDSHSVLTQFQLQDLHKYIRIEFYKESGVDAGGLEREWFEEVTSLIFAPESGLFTCGGGNSNTLGAHHINPTSSIYNTKHLSYFKFIGRFIGKAILGQRSIKAHLSVPLRKQIISMPITFSDLEFVDEDLYRNLKWLKKNKNISNLMLDFSVSYLGANNNHVSYDLKPGGSEILVTDQNKEEYLQLRLRHRMLDSIKLQLENFLNGLYEVIPADLLSVFDYQELDLLLCGLPDIDIMDWKKNTEYLGAYKAKDMSYYKIGANHYVVKWFWHAVSNMSNEERIRLLQFTTGCSRLPAQGFKALQSTDGKYRKFNIQSIFKSDSIYPRAHTCFNKLDLPIYAQQNELEAYLSVVINLESATGFTMD